MKTVSNRRTKLVLAMGALLSLLAGTSAQADDFSMAEASATFSNLRFTVVDLDLSDGIAASAVFNGGAILFASVVGDPSDSPVQTFDLNALPTQASPMTLAAGTYTMSSSSMSLSTAVYGSDLKPATLNGLSYSSDTARAMQIGFPMNEDRAFSTKVTLSANTALIISGNAEVRAEARGVGDAVNALFASAPPGVINYSTEAYAQVSMGLAAPTQFDDSSGWPQPITSSSSNVVLDLSAVVNGDAIEAHAPQKNTSFALSVGNGTAASVDEDFTLQLFAGARVLAESVSNIPQVPSIPEPGTYALMGLGLAGIALARQRRQ